MGILEVRGHQGPLSSQESWQRTSHVPQVLRAVQQGRSRVFLHREMLQLHPLLWAAVGLVCVQRMYIYYI